MESILITGATGFLGEYLIKELSNDYFVYALGRNLQKKDYLEQFNANFCFGDFTNIDQCDEYFKNIDYVVHAGALSSAWGSWDDFYNANVLGTSNVAKLCRKHHIKRLVYISSPSIYSGKCDRFYIKENEFDSSNTLNYYIKSKIMSERMLLEEYPDLYTVILRPRGLIGKGDPSLVPRLLHANNTIGIPLFHKGLNLVDITCVENVAYAVRLCITSSNIQHEVFNITNDEPLPFKEILELFLSSVNIAPHYLSLPLPFMYRIACIVEFVYKHLHIKKEPSVTKYTICTLGYSQTLNIEKAKRYLNYEPKILLKEGIKKYGESR